MAEVGTVKTRVIPPSTVRALGKSVVELYSVLGASFKRILRRDQFTWDSKQKWGYVGIDANVMIWIPAKE